MNTGKDKLRAVIGETYHKYPAIERTLPGKVTALRKELSKRLDIAFDAPTEGNSGDTPEGGRRCRADRTMHINSMGHAVCRLIVTIELPTPFATNAHIAATMTVWEEQGSWRARINSNESLSADEQIERLATQLMDALEGQCREFGIKATAPRGRYESGPGWGVPPQSK